MPQSQLSIKIYESVIASVQNAINFCFLLNGGAAIATITFLGSEKSDATMIGNLVFPMSFFATGVLVSATSAVLLYMTQFSYYKKEIGEEMPFSITGTSLRIVVLSTIIVSACLFSIGAITAMRSLS